MKSSAHNQRVRILPGQTKDTLKVQDIPMSVIQANPHQPRQHFDELSLAELAQSIERHGLLQPITVMRDPKNKGGYRVIAGERRFRAFQLLQREFIPAVISSGNPDELSLIENLQREDLNAIEEAQALAKLKDKYNYTHEELGLAIGKARSTITNLLKLNDLPRKIKQESLTSNLVNKSVLIELSKIPETKEQLRLWKELKTTGATVRQARAKKQGSEKKQSDLQRTLSNGKRFVSELERLSQNPEALPQESYEELLELFKRFIAVIDQEAERTS